MKFNWNIAAPIIIVIVVVVVLVVGPSADVSMVDDMSNQNELSKNIVLPDAKGDVDDTVDAILAMAENEADIILAESLDLDLVDSEIQALDDFINTYDVEGI